MEENEKRPIADERKLHQTEGVARITDFTNAVTGVAITLLIVDVKAPQLPEPVSEQALAAKIFSLWPHFIAYLVSFFIIGENWIVYHRIFSHIERYDETLYWLNLFFLLFVAALPFPTSLVSMYPYRKLPALLYAGTVMLVISARTLIWWYVTRDRRLVHKTIDPRLVSGGLRNEVLLVVGFLVSAVIAYFSTVWAIYLWIILAAVSIVTRLSLYNSPD